MQPEIEYRLVLCTCPDQECALTIGSALVEQGLAACVSLVPGLTSLYRWKGAVQQDPEVLLLVKTRTDRLADLTESLRRLHPYDLPEIIAVAIVGGLPEYLSWIDQCTRTKTPVYPPPKA